MIITEAAPRKEPSFDVAIPESVMEMQPATQATILLANPLGPYKHLYSRDYFKQQYRYLKTLGYNGPVTHRAINEVHDMNLVESELYEKDMVHGYQARRIDIEERRTVRARAVAVTIFDFDLLREHVSAGVRPFNAVSRRAAVELMLKMADQPPLDY